MIVLLLLTIAQPARAQLTEVQPGARVRVRASGVVAGRFVGTVLQRNADTIRIGATNALPVDVPVSRISSFEISRGNSRALGGRAGMVWGAGVGLLVGLLTPGETFVAGKAGYVVELVGAGVMWGGGIGAIVGREEWQSFELNDRPATTVEPRRGGLGVSIVF